MSIRQSALKPAARYIVPVPQPPKPSPQPDQPTDRSVGERLLRLPELVHTIGVSRATIYRYVDGGRLPPPVKLHGFFDLGQLGGFDDALFQSSEVGAGQGQQALVAERRQHVDAQHRAIGLFGVARRLLQNLLGQFGKRQRGMRDRRGCAQKGSSD